jgi:hypothetical protein
MVAACVSAIAQATLVGHWMRDQKIIISSSSVLQRYVKPLVLAAFAVVNTH